MKRDLFRRYAWLVDTIRHANKIPFEEIERKWRETPLNEDNSQLALRTFHNHRQAIENLFGIRIICGRGDHNRYYIEGWPENNTTRLRIWMLQQLSFSGMDEEIEKISHRIILDTPPNETLGLMDLIEAIHHNTIVKLVYSLPVAGGKTTILAAPYCLRFCKGEWFLLGKDSETDEMHTFRLNRILQVDRTDSTFIYPDDFNAMSYMQDIYDMDLDPALKPERIIIRVCGPTRDKLRTLPIHQSQKEVLIHNGYSIFEFYLTPSTDFRAIILSYGQNAEVLQPQYLRDEIGNQVKSMATTYSGSPER